ncbi:agamous-like MADS-box protein AGL23 [Triticum dicoccoides]|uniref:agamous-like MADS-box protein AGL23 n=1 Tax=Triticum dicoccoides TaxID=85692 RepID=UPI00188F0C9A|nr:agamous-like MADS-box protein AGL23 [Triticum dicoccoides]
MNLSTKKLQDLNNCSTLATERASNGSVQRGGESGRKKTVIRRIKQDDATHVCFSKGCVGFFSKASDLAVLTGTQVAALTFSPGGNAFSFGHPSVDTVVERFLVGKGAGAGAREEGAASDDQKMEKRHQEFDEMRTDLSEVKKRTEREEVSANERDTGEPIAAWVDPNVRDMGDEDMVAFFAALMQVKDIVSERANQVLLRVDVSRMKEQQMLMELPLAQAVTAGMDMQEMPPPLVFAAGMDMEEMQMVIPHLLGFDDEMGMPLSPEIPAGLETNADFLFPY